MHYVHVCTPGQVGWLSRLLTTQYTPGIFDVVIRIERYYQQFLDFISLNIDTCTVHYALVRRIISSQFANPKKTK